MSRYTVRIELHSSQYTPDFENLHRAMQSKGFSKLITAVNAGTTYCLPRGEYSISTSHGISDVLSLAEQAVTMTGRKAEILVTKSAGRMWSGLTEKK